MFIVQKRNAGYYFFNSDYFGKFDEINYLSSYGWPRHYFLQLKLEILQNSTFVNIDSGMIGVELIGTRFVQKKNLF